MSIASPFHPQTNGKLERYHRTIKINVSHIPYDVSGNLEVAIADFVNYYNNRHSPQGSGKRGSLGRIGKSQEGVPGEAKEGFSWRRLKTQPTTNSSAKNYKAAERTAGTLGDQITWVSSSILVRLSSQDFA